MVVKRGLIVPGRSLGALATRVVSKRWASDAASAAAATSVAAPKTEMQRAKPFEDIPGPKGLPLIGNLWRFLPVIGDLSNKDLLQIIDYMWQKYGDIVRFDFPGRPQSVFLLNAHDIEKVFRNEGPMPERPGLQTMLYYRKHVRPDWFRGKWGVAVSQGEDWSAFRKKVNNALMQPRSAKLYVRPIDDVAADFVERMVQMRDEKMLMPKDFLNELHKWALESVVFIALDTRLGCLEPNLAADSEPQQMINTLHELVESLAHLELSPSPWKYISTPAWRRFTRALDYHYQMSMRHINAAMERIKEKTAASSGDLSVLEQLLISNNDPGVACVMALDMLQAGVDTTSNATANVLYLLSKNPEVQERLFRELRAQMESPSQPMTSAKLEECRYLKACVRETLRMKPITAVNLRQCVVDDLILSGYHIRRGVSLMMANPQLSMSPEHFPSPDQFRPERWLKGSGGKFEAQSAHPFASLPFGFGPRMCIGRRFAELEVYTLVARVVRRFRLEFDGEMTWKVGFITTADSPLTLKVTDREE